MAIRAIVAVDRNGAIGCAGRLLVSVPKDLKQFSTVTRGGIVVMGRKTWDSLPGTSGLPNRENWVLTQRSVRAFPDSVRVFSSEESLRQELLKQKNQSIWIIGGARLYHSLLDLCSSVRLTKLDYTAPESDVWFPDLDTDPNWLGREEETVAPDGEAPGFTVWWYDRVEGTHGLD